MKRKPWTLVVSVVVLLAMTSVGLAKKPEKNPPAEESVCDGLDGAASGLCKAYCEALDCDSDDPRGSGKNCDKMLDHFQRITGDDPPCLPSLPSLPSLETLCPDLCVTNVDQYLTEAYSLPFADHILECSYDETLEAGRIYHFGLGIGFPYTFGNILDEVCSAEIYDASGVATVFIRIDITPVEQAACAGLFADEFAALTGITCDVSAPAAP